MGVGYQPYKEDRVRVSWSLSEMIDVRMQGAIHSHTYISVTCTVGENT